MQSVDCWNEERTVLRKKRGTDFEGRLHLLTMSEVDIIGYARRSRGGVALESIKAGTWRGTRLQEHYKKCSDLKAKPGYSGKERIIEILGTTDRLHAMLSDATILEEEFFPRGDRCPERTGYQPCYNFDIGKKWFYGTAQEQQIKIESAVQNLLSYRPDGSSSIF